MRIRLVLEEVAAAVAPGTRIRSDQALPFEHRDEASREVRLAETRGAPPQCAPRLLLEAPSRGDGFILDYHHALDFKKQDNTWRGSFGIMQCRQDDMNNTRGVQPPSPAHSWHTDDTTGVEC
jgi:hypothetical protein